MTNPIRTFRSKPFVAIARHTGDVLGSAHNLALASAIGAARVGEGDFRVIDLSDVGGFESAAVSAHDIDGAAVAQYAAGTTLREIAAWLTSSRNASYITDGDTVADRIKRACGGKLSRDAARRQVAAWILEGAVG